MDPITHLRRLYAYEKDATRKCLDSLRAARARLETPGAGAVAAEAAPYIRAVEIFAHVQMARRIWLSRIAAPGEVDPPRDGLFPSWPLERTEKEAGEMDALWDGSILRLVPTQLDRLISYRTSEGTDRAANLHDILTHVVNHSSYHRGQIARLVAECGAKAAITDFIMYALEHPANG